MSQERPGGRSNVGSTGYSPEVVEAAVAAQNSVQAATQKLLDALDQVGREVEIAAMTLDGCADLEGTAYHLRRALANLKFAGGVLIDLRKRKT